MGSTTIFVIEVKSEGLVAELRLNGATVFEELGGGPRFLQTKLDPYVVEGENTLDVVLGPPPPPEGSPAPPPPAKAFSLRVFSTEWGVAGPDEPLAGFAFDEADHPLPDRGSAPVARLAFTPAAAHGRWAWQDARPFGPGDEGDAIALVLDVHRALAARDAGAIDAITEVKMTELGRALDVPADELRADQRAHYAQYFGAPDYRVAPLDPTRLRLVPSDDGRLVRVVDAAGGPPLRASGGGKRFALGLTLSHVEGGFRVVR